MTTKKMPIRWCSECPFLEATRDKCSLSKAPIVETLEMAKNCPLEDYDSTKEELDARLNGRIIIDIKALAKEMVEVGTRPQDVRNGFSHEEWFEEEFWEAADNLYDLSEKLIDAIKALPDSPEEDEWEE